MELIYDDFFEEVRKLSELIEANERERTIDARS